MALSQSPTCQRDSSSNQNPTKNFRAFIDRLLLNHRDSAESLDALALEDRVFFSAVPFDASAIDSIDIDLAEASDFGFEAELDDPRRELVIVDSSINDASVLIDNILSQNGEQREIEVISLDDIDGGIESISDLLANYADLDALHIVSHGSDGQLLLGEQSLDIEALTENHDAIEAWGNALADDGDILLYGCDVAGSEVGEQFISSFSTIVGADVAASTDVTGNSELGGNWVLEANVGIVDSSFLFTAEAEPNWLGTLDATVTVTTTSDLENGDTSSIAALILNDGGDGISLREAIEAADNTVGADTIEFDIDGAGPHRISILTELDINDTVTIDGYSQAGASANTLAVGSNASLMIEINGLMNTDNYGIEISSDNSVITGLVINQMNGTGIKVEGDNNTIAGNFIGTDTTGLLQVANNTNGILIKGDDNLVGGTADAARNIIAGNFAHGIEIDNAVGNQISNNYVGLGADGDSIIANSGHGIYVDGGSGNFIGQAGAGNVISGNANDGVRIDNSTGNRVHGNLIGTDATGTLARGNENGVVFELASNNSIGGSNAGEGNVISGNLDDGISLRSGVTNSIIAGNLIGTDVTGTVGLGNADIGIRMNNDVTGTMIGGSGSNSGNVIADHGSFGIRITGDFTTVLGNYIGIDRTETIDLGNMSSGIYVDATNVTIGDGSAAGANVIAYNSSDGIVVFEKDDLRIRRNEIFFNGDLAIDHQNDGVTPNLITDGIQNYVAFDGIYHTGNDVIFVGSLVSVLGADFTVDVFTTPPGQPDPSGHGEARQYAGSINIENLVPGVPFALGVAGLGNLLDPGDIITTTTTQVGGHTSEFSANVQIQSIQPNIDLDLDDDSGATGNDYQTTFSSGSSPISIVDTDVTISDNTNVHPSGPATTIESVTIQITNVADGTDEILSATAFGSIIVDASVAGQITLTGTDSIANYEQVLRSLTYENTALIPTAGVRNIEFIVNDGAYDSEIATTQLDVIPGSQTISGHIFEDVDGDSLGGNDIDSVGTTVYLYRDDGNGIADAADSLVRTVQTDASGDYSFEFLTDGDYWIVVDSHTISPSAGLDGTQSDIWAEQTYGSSGSVYFDGSLDRLSSGGTLYGGRHADRSDDVSNAGTAEHVIQTSLIAGSNSSGHDFGFSFNVVTNTLGGDTIDGDIATDHDVDDARSVQGSLRQFIQNANAIKLGNEMRFVPTGVEDVTSGSNSWWQIVVTEEFDPITGSETIINGQAYSTSDGVTPIDMNSTVLGYQGSVGVDPDGIPASGDEQVLSGVDAPELEIINDRTNGVVDIGLNIQSSDVIVENIGIHGFGMSSDDDGNIVIGSSNSTNFTGNILRNNVIGGSVDGFTAPTAGFETETANVTVFGADGVVIENNLIGFAGSHGVKLSDEANGTIVRNNEIIRNGLIKPFHDGIDIMRGSSGTQIIGNLIEDNEGVGVDGFRSQGFNTIQQNTIRNNGLGGDEHAGIRLWGTSNQVTFNQILDNNGAGVLVLGDQGQAGTPSTNNLISQNAFGGNGGLSIDLVEAFGDEDLGDGVSENGVANDNDAGNDGYDYPLLDSATVAGGTTTIVGTAGPNATIEFYLASGDGDGSDTNMATGFDHGEGLTYLGSTTADGLGDFTWSATGLSAGQEISAIAIAPNDSTSEFSENIEINTPPSIDNLIPDQTALEDNPWSLDIANGNFFDDPDPGDTLTYSVSLAGSLPAWASFDGTAISGTPLEGDDGTLLIEVVATDPDGATSTQTFQLTVGPVDDAPVVTPSGTSATFIENGAAVVVDGAIAISDIDSATIESAEVRITTNFDSIHDALIFSDTADITGNYNSATGILTLMGTDSLANYEAALQSIQFANSNENPIITNRGISVTVFDGSENSSAAVVPLTIQPLNDAPIVNSSGNVPNFVEDGGPVVVDSLIAVDDVDSANLTEANIQITTGFDSVNDSLIFADTANITGTYDAATGLLRLIGLDTVANYEAALQSIRFDNSNENPIADRDIEFTVIDDQGVTSPSAALVNLNTQGTNDAPNITPSGSTATFLENGPAVNIDPAITVDDVDSTTIESARVRIGSGFDATHDSLIFADTASISGSYNSATGILTLMGTDTLANYEAALQSVQFANSNENSISNNRIIRFLVFDGQDTSTAAVIPLAIQPMNDAPTINPSGNVPTFFEDGPSVVIDSTMSVADVDSAMLTEAQIQITTGFDSANDSLIFIDMANITGTYDSATGLLLLTGTDTVANYETALQSIRFDNSDQNLLSDRDVSFSVFDGQTTSSATVVHIDTDAANDAPEVVASGSVATYVEDGPAVVVDSTISVGDVDSNFLTGAKIRIMGGFDPDHDSLLFTNTGNITGTYDPDTGTLTLSGPASVASYEAALQSVRFANSNQNPGNGGRTITFVVSDTQLTSTPTTANLAVKPVNDSPTAMNDTRTISATGSTGIINSVLTNDSDVDGGNLTVTVVSGPSSGSITMFNNGQFIYTPGENFAGTDSFVYEVADGKGGTDTAVVTLEGQLAPPPPVVDGNENTGDEDEEIDESEEEITPNGANIMDDEGEDGSNGRRRKANSESSDFTDNVDVLVPYLSTKSGEADLNRFSGTSNSNRSSAEALIEELSATITTPPIFVESNVFQVGGQLNSALSELAESMSFETGFHDWQIGGAIAASAGISVGYVLWTIRGGYLLASVLSSMPAWSTFDPLPILDQLEGKTDEGESLEGMIDRTTGTFATT